jgi:hypothetical protein
VTIEARVGKLNPFSRVTDHQQDYIQNLLLSPLLRRLLVRQTEFRRKFELAYSERLRQVIYGKIPKEFRSEVHYLVGRLFANILESPNFQQHENLGKGQREKGEVEGEEGKRR